MGLSGSLLGWSWGGLGASWGLLGASWEGLGASLGGLGAVLGALEMVLVSPAPNAGLGPLWSKLTFTPSFSPQKRARVCGESRGPARLASLKTTHGRQRRARGGGDSLLGPLGPDLGLLGGRQGGRTSSTNVEGSAQSDRFGTRPPPT